ncbi:MAG TPA: YihY/virulence factor BrkB family protein [Solirubrobacteraceae bacterium]|nr:YihY/virulence factor BrkB family protein [Solirubrobacteraceae bacterium]
MSVERDAPADREPAVVPTSNADAAAPNVDETAAPKGPTRLPRQSWRGVFTRTFREYKADNLSDWAAALTYYGVLAIFPAAIALISIVGLIGHSATSTLINNLGKLAPGTARTVFISAIQGLQKSRGAAGVLFVVGILGALWSASSYVAAFMRASNAIYNVEEGRPFWMTYPVRLAVTIVMVVLLTAGALAVVITGGLAGQVGKLLGVGGNAVAVWDIAKWPVLLLVVGAMFAILYWASPNVKQPGFRWLTPGGLFAVAVWVLASALFALYVANFGSYNRTYGALAGVIIFLVWLWITNVAILLGAELNAELARARVIEAGHPADVEPFVEPRRQPKPASSRS